MTALSLLLAVLVPACAGAFKGDKPVQGTPAIRAVAPLPGPAASSIQPGGKPAVVQAVGVAPPAALGPARAAPSAEAGQPVSARGQLDVVGTAWDDKRESASVAAASPEPGAARRLLSRLGRVIAFSFDWDDNLTGPAFPTRVYLYKTGTSERLAVKTSEWADIRKKVGTDFAFNGVNLKDYALGKGSFERFGDGPNGENYFLEDLKYAVEHLAPEQWQGPSWKAFVEALSDPETAEWTAIITARGMSAKSMMEGLEYLRSQGFIKHLPALEHLNLVGGAADPSAKKAEVEQAILDRIAAQPISAHAPEIVNQDGTGRARLHTAGFSDDDWGNIEAMRDRLTAAIGADPKRWENVKIVLYFTGTNQPQHAPGAYALTTDGRTRWMPAEETARWKDSVEGKDVPAPRRAVLEPLRPWAPHAVTAMNLISGVGAILAAAHGGLLLSAGLILLANLFDAFDGRVARALGVAGPLGVQLDSLADVVSFGVAPAILLYSLFLAPLGPVGFAAAAAFAAGGMYRLARFNVGAAEPEDPAKPKPDSFTGLPIPGGAGVAVAFALAASSLPAALVAPAAVAVSLLTAAAMVSRLPYPAFKKGGLKPFAVAALGASALASFFSWTLIPAAVFGLYLAAGPLAALRLKK